VIWKVSRSHESDPGPKALTRSKIIAKEGCRARGKKDGLGLGKKSQKGVTAGPVKHGDEGTGNFALKGGFRLLRRGKGERMARVTNRRQNKRKREGEQSDRGTRLGAVPKGREGTHGAGGRDWKREGANGGPEQ